MTIKKKLSTAALALLLSLLLPLCLPSAARAEWTKSDANRYNVVLLVDKSGSLACQGEQGTDPDGLRYEALRLFLGLLTESGNNVGTVVFDEFIRFESEVQPLEGMEAKKALIRRIEQLFPEYDTDIGRAVLRATEMLRDMKAQNDLPCLILLFSDGMTDFETGDIEARKIRSYEDAQQAMETAVEEGITISGILLNVDSVAERGRIEFQLYTRATKGEYEEVTKAEDLSSAFRRLYHIINHTVYTGSQRVAFSEQGEAEIYFTVPSFGVEEVNVIVEGEKLQEEEKKDDEAARVDFEILRPSGNGFDIDGHELDSARYRLVKIPEPDLGIWSVRLRGEPNDWVDVTMVCNATLGVFLFDDSGEFEYRTLTPYRFAAYVEDPAVPQLTEEQLGELKAVLVREELATGAVREFEMALQDGIFAPREKFSFPRDGEYRLSTVVSLGDFKVQSNTLDVSVALTPLVAQVDAITDMTKYGRFGDRVWELALAELFGVSDASEVLFTLSDDCDGRVSIENGVLQAQILDTKPFSFTLTAEDPAGQHQEISFDLPVPRVTAATSTVSDLGEWGRFLDPVWEIGLSELFHDPKGGELTYVLSDDCGGAVTIDDGVLQAVLEEGAKPLTFVLTATDYTDQNARVSFDLSYPTLTARIAQVTDPLTLGSLHDFQWELSLDGLFSDPMHLPLTYTVSDDYNGAVTIEDGVLRVYFSKLREAGFELTAENSIGRKAVISFDLKLPGPTATVGEITDTVKTGLFQENVWERRIDGLFKEPKGTALVYSLSDDLGGAAQIDGSTLRVNMKGLRKAAFSIIATDEYGLSAEIPVTLTGRNMTLLYALGGLAALALVSTPVGIITYRRKH